MNHYQISRHFVEVQGNPSFHSGWNDIRVTFRTLRHICDETCFVKMINGETPLPFSRKFIKIIDVCRCLQINHRCLLKSQMFYMIPNTSRRSNINFLTHFFPQCSLLIPRKTSENQMFSLIFSGGSKGNIRKKGFNTNLHISWVARYFTRYYQNHQSNK